MDKLTSMVGNNDTIATSFQGKLCVFRLLYAFEDNWAVPILPQESNFFPGVRFARKTSPIHARDAPMMSSSTLEPDSFSNFARKTGSLKPIWLPTPLMKGT
jgi:hypothetical protein